MNRLILQIYFLAFCSGCGFISEGKSEEFVASKVIGVWQNNLSRWEFWDNNLGQIEFFIEESDINLIESFSWGVDEDVLRVKSDDGKPKWYVDEYKVKMISQTKDQCLLYLKSILNEDVITLKKTETKRRCDSE